MYTRLIQTDIEQNLFKRKAVVLYGARQVGKTTLVRQILAKYRNDALYLNADEPDIRASLTDQTSTALKQLIGNHRLVVIDEAQRIKNIGLTIKLIVDNYPEIQIIATGSSSLDLSNKITEPLTGRKIEFHLNPLSIEEFLTQETPIENKRLLESRLRFGCYPGIINQSDKDLRLIDMAKSYLYGDVLEYQTIRNPDIFYRLLQALALQIGSEVSFNEIANLFGLDKATVARYVSLLIQAYIIFELPPFSRNQRRELGKLRKIYFYDLGIRNALINNFNPLDLRQDVGALWENYVISERIKFNAIHRRRVNSYFWRTYAGKELDYIEEVDRNLFGFECKWGQKQWKAPGEFLDSYPESKLACVSPENYLEIILAEAPTQPG